MMHLLNNNIISLNNRLFHVFPAVRSKNMLKKVTKYFQPWTFMKYPFKFLVPEIYCSGA